ncbi:permease [Acanthopleuribacter pedis]|uniref:Permease n=1 Tax=Acanthopleuribacter pedis TaxID=442870 RepID=A0A8J7Q9N0_9BACT|nr:permease [Acanthopleuribacter pedis]MBO1319519.1 permease [Acanthopleuribacter pedis]
MLLISLLPLFAAPLLHILCQRNTTLAKTMDGFIFMAIGGLILMDILPAVVYAGGWWTLPLLLLGFLVPTLSERVWHNVRGVHRAALVFGLVGLFIHAVTDGAALVHTGGGDHGHGHHHDHESLLSLGVLLHRIPIGLTIWYFVRPQFGRIAAWGVLCLIALGTFVGYHQAEALLAPLSTAGMAYFQAFVVGSLLHILFHRPHADGESCDHHHGKSNWAEGFGNLLGVLFVAQFSHQHHLSETAWFDEMTHALLDLTLESAPALVLAYVLAGLATSFVPKSYAQWMGRGRPLMQSFRGMVVGLPLPVCSCGVVPLYHTLVRKGAPPTAAMAFLIATPELGIDAVLISLPLLGETMTGIRIVAAALVALTVGILIGRLAKPNEEPSAAMNLAENQDLTWQQKVKQGFTHGMGELVDHTGPWILFGLLIAAAMQPFLGNGMLSQIPAGWEVPLFALLGMPLYVCASGATPLIAVFLFHGVSPGAALAFLITGPATNVTTFGVLSRLHGPKIAAAFGGATFVITVLLGFATNWLVPEFDPKPVIGEHHHGSLLQNGSTAILILMFGYSWLRRGARAFLGELITQGHDHDHDHDHGHGHGHAHHHHGDCGHDHGHGHKHDHGHHQHDDHGHDHKPDDGHNHAHDQGDCAHDHGVGKGRGHHNKEGR